MMDGITFWWHEILNDGKPQLVIILFSHIVNDTKEVKEFFFILQFLDICTVSEM